MEWRWTWLPWSYDISSAALAVEADEHMAVSPVYVHLKHDSRDPGGIGPNAAINGVFLKKQLHKRTFGDAYRESVNEIIEYAYSNFGCGENVGDGVIGALKLIAKRLEDGAMPG